MKKGSVFFLLLIGLFACSESSVIGEGFIESLDYELALNNTTELTFSTIRYDSLPTSDVDRLLIGGKTGAEFGDFEAVIYFLLDLNSTDFSEYSESLHYDSITFTLPMDGYTAYLDESVLTESVVIEQLADELVYLEDEDALYNYSEVGGVTDVAGTVLAEQAFFWASDRIRDHQVRLPDEFGNDLFERLGDEDEIFSDQGEANEYLKGFKVYLKNADFAVGLATDSIRFTIHTTDVSTSSQANVDFDFYIGDNPYYCKYLHANVPEALVVEDVEDEVPSDSLENYSYIVGGLGYATKIDLSAVRDLLLDGEDFILANAELQLSWLTHEQDNYPTSLNAQLIDEDFTDLTGGEVFTFDRVYDDEYGRDNYYLLNMATIVESILAQSVGGSYFLLLTTEDFNTTPTFVKLGDQSFSSELNVYTIKN